MLINNVAKILATEKCGWCLSSCIQHKRDIFFISKKGTCITDRWTVMKMKKGKKGREKHVDRCL